MTVEDMEQEMKERWLKEGRPEVFSYFCEVRNREDSTDYVTVIRLEIKREKVSTT
jgi:hypothetical protein